MTTASNNATTTYFNLHTQGIGYLNRVREVPVRRGQAFMACDIAALHGASDDVEYTRFDCKVAGGEAERLIREHLEDVRAERKVLIAFRIGDLWVDPFLYEKGERKGQPGASLKGRLIFIEWIKVDGQFSYRAPARTDAASGAMEQAEAEGDRADIDSDSDQCQPTPTTARESTAARQSA
ncbi:STY4534 family ICE replication protein [Pseudomonas juntendi]|uniref:STY4534 family ICE replication protein n=1 Tax=Pseudomonas juntendi TaxID=2666183 RepID=UPI001F1E6D4F|nr:STY4534 family ICE replication protein [Pseudomonas juntendi]MCO7054906.1 STY4534 family ICE replication protein [Pseudomonas juntendi]UJM14726.1 STY4534 family ICE replication protein [Pseudomonas juntendi]